MSGNAVVDEETYQVQLLTNIISLIPAQFRVKKNKLHSISSLSPFFGSDIWILDTK
jgi:hypothetical protein